MQSSILFENLNENSCNCCLMFIYISCVSDLRITLLVFFVYENQQSGNSGGHRAPCCFSWHTANGRKFANPVF